MLALASGECLLICQRTGSRPGWQQPCAPGLEASFMAWHSILSIDRGSRSSGPKIFISLRPQIDLPTSPPSSQWPQSPPVAGFPLLLSSSTLIFLMTTHSLAIFCPLVTSLLLFHRSTQLPYPQVHSQVSRRPGKSSPSCLHHTREARFNREHGLG